jgi:hypothetical protein
LASRYFRCRSRCSAAANAMKQRSQETPPLWVWFSLGLLVIAIIAYAVGYLMFEQINPD